MMNEMMALGWLGMLLGVELLITMLIVRTAWATFSIIPRRCSYNLIRRSK